MADDWRQHVINNMLPRMEATEPAGGFTPAPMVIVPAPTPLPTCFSPPSYDVLDALAGAPVSAEKLRLMRDRRSEKYYATPSFDDVNAESMRKIGAANDLKRLTDHPQEGGFGLKPDDRQVIAAQRALDRATDDSERIKRRSETLTAAWQAAGAALTNVESWLRHGRPPGVQLVDFDGPEPTLLKGEKGPLDAVANRQRRAREIKASIHAFENAPYFKSDARAKMLREIEALAMLGGPVITNLIEHDRLPIIWPTRLASSTFGPAVSLELPDTLALITWLFKDELIAKLNLEIDAEGDDANALTKTDREVRIAEAMGDLLAVEREEAHWVFEAQKQDLPIEHRADISPLALLGLRLVTAPRVDGLPPTSVEHAITFAGGRR